MSGSISTRKPRPIAQRPPLERIALLLQGGGALDILLFGAPHFFVPRSPLAVFFPNGGVEAASFYDTSPLKATLERLVDFDRINADLMHFSVGAVNVRSGNFAYFDSKASRIAPSHIIASGSLPPGFPPTEIDGECYWDGGLVSNTPLQHVLDARPRQDTLAFQVDLWNAEGELPRSCSLPTSWKACAPSISPKADRMRADREREPPRDRCS
jgi:NTE family protein